MTCLKRNSWKQCDKMARLVFKIWPFTTMKICPMAYQIYQVMDSNYDYKRLLLLKLNDN